MKIEKIFIKSMGPISNQVIDLSDSAHEGNSSFVGIHGFNGSGKTTLIEALSGLGGFRPRLSGKEFAVGFSDKTGTFVGDANKLDTFASQHPEYEWSLHEKYSLLDKLITPPRNQPPSVQVTSLLDPIKHSACVNEINAFIEPMSIVYDRNSKTWNVQITEDTHYPAQILSRGYTAILYYLVIAHVYLEENAILLLDTPEDGLHLDNQEKLVDALFRVVKAKNAQLIVTTHSPEIINPFQVEGIVVSLNPPKH